MKKQRGQSRGQTGKKQWITALGANEAGEIFELEGYAAAGMANGVLVSLTREETRSVPYGGEFHRLPNRRPLVFNISANRFEVLDENPYMPGEPVFPVAVFNSPGYVNCYISAYEEKDPEDFLPLFSYGAVGWHGESFHAPLVLVDKEPRQDLRQMPIEKVRAGVDQMRKRLPSNRLCRHLERCALEYGCPAGKNFFLGRYEAPLPTSQSCNARCLGCISLQKNTSIPCSQERIDFTPSPDDIAELALTHIHRVKQSVVSFGQGCEGDPLLAWEAIEPAIRKIRAATSQGTINLNTNASRPDLMEKLWDAGLDSLRVSINSLRESCYTAYFRPAGYGFPDVMDSIRRALLRGKFVSINYLNCAGFTDTPEETAAFIRFRKKYPIHMIQWRNLNYDPVKYWKTMNLAAENGSPLGMKTALRDIRKNFPDLIYGYFNPPKEKWGRF